MVVLRLNVLAGAIAVRMGLGLVVGLVRRLDVPPGGGVGEVPEHVWYVRFTRLCAVCVLGSRGAVVLAGGPVERHDLRAHFVLVGLVVSARTTRRALAHFCYSPIRWS